MSHDVFISHSSIDKNIADAVTAALEQSQIRCWIAPRDILPGESWGGSIVDAIEASRVMVIVFSANSNDSKQVMREVERAVQKDVVVVPFRVEAVEPSKDMEYFLSATHWLDAITPEMDNHLTDLVSTVQVLLNKSDGSDQAKKISKPLPAASQPAAASPSQAAAKRSLFKPAVAVAAIAALALAAFLFLGGESEEQVAQSGAAEKKITAKDLGERAEGSIKLKFPKQATAAEKLAVQWSGKSAANDRLLLANADAQDTVQLHYAAAGDGNETELQMPGEPGTYEVRFQNMANRKVIARKKIEVLKPSVTLSVSAPPLPGGSLDVAWEAPNNKGDFITIAEPEAKGSVYNTYSYTRAGSPTSIRVPDVPGEYELRYVSALDKAVWAKQTITVPEAQVSIKLPDEVGAGASVKLDWQGPANKGDYASVAEIDAEPGKYIAYAYARAGKDLVLKMPERAGQFEVRYLSGLSKQVWARQRVKVSMPEVSVSAPESPKSGEVVKVDWQGPANKGDYVTLAEPGSESKQYLHYVYVKAGQKAKVAMPDKPGNYVLRYVSSAKKNIWAETPVTVAGREVSLTVPSSLGIGQKIPVSWPNKGHGNEYVGIFKKGAADGKYETYARASNKTELRLNPVKEPGEYEVRYVSGKDKLVWATAPITIE